MIVFYFIIVLLLLYSLLVEPYQIIIKNISVNINNKNDGLDKIKIIHITDLHVKKFGCLERKLIDKINQLMPDILFVTGDFIKNNNGIGACAEIFKRIKPRYGIYGVLGNNDYKKFFVLQVDTDKLKKSLSDVGVKLLFNESYTVNIDGVHINILGIEDSMYGKPDISNIINKDTNGYTNILLSHSPSVIKYLNGYKPDLILAGHTHGGQVRFPFIEYLWTPLPLNSPRKYSRGLFEVNKTKMYVNQGIGTNLFPMRFLCPPEISIIKLSSNSL